MSMSNDISRSSVHAATRLGLLKTYTLGFPPFMLTQAHRQPPGSPSSQSDGEGICTGSQSFSATTWAPSCVHVVI